MDAMECPTCGSRKQKVKHFVCPKCFKLYNAEASDALAKNGDAVSMSLWVAGKIAIRLLFLEVELECLVEKKNSLQGKVREEAISFIKKSLGNKRVLPEVRITALEKKGSDLWNEHGGHRLHSQVKSLENKISSLYGLQKELEAKKEKEETAAVV